MRLIKSTKDILYSDAYLLDYSFWKRPWFFDEIEKLFYQENDEKALIAKGTTRLETSL